jgi:CheY-like chemotaxis protein
MAPAIPDRARRVLVVDDEPSLLAVLKLVVELRGWTALVARSGAAALALADRADAVVTDFCMPGMDGLALLRAIRLCGQRTPVIVLTAHRSEALAERALREGAREIVTKPFDVDVLADAIARALGGDAAGARP